MIDAAPLVELGRLRHSAPTAVYSAARCESDSSSNLYLCLAVVSDDKGNQQHHHHHHRADYYYQCSYRHHHGHLHTYRYRHRI